MSKIERKLDQLEGAIITAHILGISRHDESTTTKLRNEIIALATDKRGTYEEVKGLLADCWSLKAMMEVLSEKGFVLPKKEVVLPKFTDVDSAVKWLNDNVKNQWFVQTLQNPFQWKAWYVKENDGLRVSEVEDTLLEALNELIASLVSIGAASV